jgi:hypothetical protein
VRFGLVVLLIISVPALAWAQDDDDPGVQTVKPVSPPQPPQAPPKQPQPTIVDDDEPRPTEPSDVDPVPDIEPEDPVDVVPAHAPPRTDAPIIDTGLAISMRVKYRAFTNREIVDSAIDYGNHWFHELGIDMYPISGDFRLGLALEFGMNVHAHWQAMAGLVAGYQKRQKRITPWIEVGLHTGTGWRNYFDSGAMNPVVGGLTLLWMYGGQLGVDARLGKKLVGSAAIGVQRTDYYATTTTDMHPLHIVGDTAVTLMIGIGY